MHSSVKCLLAATVVGVASVLPAAEWAVAHHSGAPAERFSSLNEALAVAEDNDTIKLDGAALNDTTLPSVVVNVTNLTINLKWQWVTNTTVEANSNCMLKVGPRGDVRICYGWVRGNGNFIHVDGGRVRVDDIHLVYEHGKPLVVENGGSADVYNETELSLHEDSPTILVRGDRLDGAQPVGTRSTLIVRDGGLISNQRQNGAAIAGSAADTVGTLIRLVGGVNGTYAGALAKVTGVNGFAVHHPQPGRLEADGEIFGATCVAMLQGDLIVAHSNTLFCTFDAPAHPTVFDGSVPTGDLILAPMGLGHDPTVTIYDGNFKRDGLPDSICIRAVNHVADNPSYPYWATLTNNICVVGGWFQTPVLPAHCVYQPRFGGTWPFTTIPDYNPFGSPIYPYDNLNYTVRRHIYPWWIGGDPVELEEAIAEAVDHDVIHVWTDCRITNTIFVATDIRLRLHGHTIHANRDGMPASADCAFCVLPGGRLEIDGRDDDDPSVRGAISTDLPAVIQMNRSGESLVVGERAALSLNNVNVYGETYGIRCVDMLTTAEQRRTDGQHQTEIVVFNSSISVQSADAVTVGISHRQNGQLLIDGSTVSGGDGIDFCGGSLTVRNGSWIRARQRSGVSTLPSTTSDILASGVGVMVSPRYPVSICVEGGSRISGALAIYEKDLLQGYHPAWTPFSLDLGDCWIDSCTDTGLGQIYCFHGWDFRAYAIQPQSAAKFRDDNLFVGALPVRHALVRQTDDSLPTCGWYMLEQLPDTASNEVDVVFMTEKGQFLPFSKRFVFPNYLPGETFGSIHEPAPNPMGLVFNEWFTDKSFAGSPWQFDDMVEESMLTSSMAQGKPSNVLNLYAKSSLDPVACTAPPNGYLPQVFDSIKEAQSAAADMTVKPPPQVEQSLHIAPDSYQNLFTVRTMSTGGSEGAFVNQIVLRENVEALMRTELNGAAQKMPLKKLSAGNASTVRVEAVRGMFYSVVSGDSLESMAEGPRVLAEGETLDLQVPSYGSSGFYRLLASPNP